nr:MAG TPA: hypothetical protein [Caudoviricetes sp.]
MQTFLFLLLNFFNWLVNEFIIITSAHKYHLIYLSYGVIIIKSYRI